jgi:hypothetical protein
MKDDFNPYDLNEVAKDMKNEPWKGHFSPETEEGIRKVLELGEKMKKGIMRIYKVEFEGVWPVSHGLVIAAHGIEECDKIVRKTLFHTKEFTIEEVDITEPCVIFYESGEY